MGGLRDKLARSGRKDVGFLVVNDQTAESRAMFWELKRKVAKGIPVYQQGPFQDDVWETLQADKDDFLVYDRCGRLTFHIVLPYSFLHYPFIEAAILATYHKNICGNCSVDSNSTLSTPQNSTRNNDTGLAASENPEDEATGAPDEVSQLTRGAEHTPHRDKSHREGQGVANGRARPHHHGHRHDHVQRGEHESHQHSHGGQHHDHSAQ